MTFGSGGIGYSVGGRDLKVTRRHRALLERAQVNLAQHRRAAARRHLERILAEDPVYPGLLEALAALG